MWFTVRPGAGDITLPTGMHGHHITGTITTDTTTTGTTTITLTTVPGDITGANTITLLIIQVYAIIHQR